MLEEEGLENAWQRHRVRHEQLRGALEQRGLTFLVAPAQRLPQLNAVAIPEGVHEADLRRRLLMEYDIEIGAGLGVLAGKIWRIGLMGHSATDANIARLCEGLDALL
jgi:alanine-glyoxylate transaminase/serine-glyoxylate transaminase/serine-pyruvate transaminase